MNNTYELKIAGLTRYLPKVRISDNLSIAAFVMFGDTELVEKCAEELADRLKGKDIDYLVCPEAKAIPLTHAMSRIMGLNYVVVRKSVKGYMMDPIIDTVKSITTAEEQTLVLDGNDVKKVRDKNICIVDDVVSTGASLRSTEDILNRVGAKVSTRVAALLEEGGHGGDGVIYLETLPVFPD